MTQLRVQDVACEIISNNPTMTAEQLARLVRQQIPTCNCSASSIAWYKNKLKKGEIKGFSASRDPAYSAVSHESKRNLVWPDWSLPGDGELLQLARITIPYICFLHPDIVRSVVKDNEHRREEWGDRLRKCGIDPSLYLWQHSPCAFPGVRRYAGSTEIAQHRGRMEVKAAPENALKLDDNDYSKHVWSFIFRGKPFQKHGPSGYSLAHLVDHKNYKNRGQEEITNNRGDEITDLTLFGLYTSVTNTVYMPNGLIRPTDFSFLLRNLIQRKAAALYGSFCNLLPPHLSFRTNESSAWSFDAFDWREPTGTPDHVQAFLRYRNEKMETLFEPVRVAGGRAFTSAPATARPICPPSEDMVAEHITKQQRDLVVSAATIMTHAASPEAGSGLLENRGARSEARDIAPGVLARCGENIYGTVPMKGVATRNFECPMSEVPCTNPECKRDKCIEESLAEPAPRPPRFPAPVPGEGLRFEFDPSPQDVFKVALLKNKRAMKTIHYQDGHTENWPWNAGNFTEDSDLMQNLLTSRLRYWRRDKISWVEVKIIASDWREKRPNSIEAIPMPIPQPEQEKQRPPEESQQSKSWDQEKQHPSEEPKRSKWWAFSRR